MEKKQRIATVGEMRHQSALVESDCRITIKPSPGLRKLLGNNRIVLVRSYPDRCDGDGNWGSSFTIDARLDNEELEG